MTRTQAFVLGAVQGVMGFLSISSSAHLILVPWLMSWPDQGLTFDLVLHAGTLIAILSLFWKGWLQMVFGRAFQCDRKFRLAACHVTGHHMWHRAGCGRRFFGSEDDLDDVAQSLDFVGIPDWSCVAPLTC